MVDAMSKLITCLVTLPVLPEPSATAPIDLADWLTMIEPAMTDLSDSSGEWWELVAS